MKYDLKRVLMNESLAIVGNGLDLRLDFDTTYEKFYECMKLAFEANDFSTFSSTYSKYGNTESIKVFYDLVEREKDNYFINYFINYKTIFGSWVSFEDELTKIICAFDMLISFINSERDSFEEAGDLYVETENYPKLLSVLNAYPKNKFFTAYTDLQYLRTRDGYAVAFTIGGEDYKDIYDLRYRIEKFTETFPLNLYKDLVAFSRLFSNYLSIIDHPVKCNDKIASFERCGLYINYNYTTYLEQYLTLSNIPFSTLLYINGLSNEKGTISDKIVFGIDSNVELRNQRFEVFCKNIQRSLKDTDIDKIDSLLSDRITNVFIYGHSLSLADYETLNYVFSRLNVWKPHITVYFLDEDSKISLLTNLKILLGNELFDEYQKNGRIKFLPSKSV